MGLNEVQKKMRSDYLENNLIITECSQKKPFAFISYASDDWESVFKQAVVPIQKQYGLRVYADRAFDKLNDKWIVPMLRNVRGSDLMVAFVSQNYIESYACFLELLTAVNNKKQIVFVDLGGGLHLGDTTDQPNIERGVKNEILNQGANISTNTNNSSNDLMRAMKSSFTSISTLLEQDALSKYDISDAFINFFRDASINRKTINDLKSLVRTIKSVSSSVFDKALVHNPQNQAPDIRVKAYESQDKQAEEQPVRSEQPGAESAEPSAQTIQPEAGSEAPSSLSNQAEAGTAAQPVQNYQPEAQAAVEYSLDELAQKGKAEPRGRKTAKILIGAVAGLALVIIAFVLISSRSKQVEAMAYEISFQEDGNKTQLYSGEYTGEWKSGQPYNEGVFTYVDESNSDNSFVCEGVWEDGKMNGQGTKTWGNGDVYEGEFADNFRNGQGTYTYNENDQYNRVSYVGEWKDNLKNGQGTMTWTSGAVYEGEWKDGQRSGQGTHTYAEDDDYNRLSYTGQWENDKPSGQGTMTWKSGNVYEGEWKDGQRSGQGTATYGEGDENGRRDYVGQWENDKFNGQGTMTWTNGNVYEGEWKDGQRSGQGTITSARGEAYEGEWKDDMRNGQGTMTYAKDDEYKRRDYVGQWENGKQSGQGTMTWTNGNFYEGEWKDGLRNGRGKHTSTDGTIHEGEWKDDKFVG